MTVVQEAAMNLADEPPGMHWTRYNPLAERLEHQNNIWTIAMMQKLGIVLLRLRRTSLILLAVEGVASSVNTAQELRHGCLAISARF